MKKGGPSGPPQGGIELSAGTLIPDFTAYDPRDGRLPYTISSGNLVLTKALPIKAPNSVGLSFCENSAPVEAPHSTKRSPLRRLIDHIVSVRAEKQMVGIDASRVVAVMTNTFRGGERDLVDFLPQVSPRLLVTSASPKLRIAILRIPHPTAIGPLGVFFLKALIHSLEALAIHKSLLFHQKARWNQALCILSTATTNRCRG